MSALGQLEAAARRQLSLFEYPTRNWMLPPARDAYDVAILGAGPRACAVALGLRRERIDRVVLIDTGDPDETLMYAAATAEPVWRRADFAGHEVDLGPFSFRSWLDAASSHCLAVPYGRSLRASWQRYGAWLRTLLDLTVLPAAAIAEVRVGSGSLVMGCDGASVQVRRLVVATSDADLPTLRTSLPACCAGRTVSILGGGAADIDLIMTALFERDVDRVYHCMPPPCGTHAWDDAGLVLGFPHLDTPRRAAIITAARKQVIPPPPAWLVRLRGDARYRPIDPASWPPSAPVLRAENDMPSMDLQWQDDSGAIALSSMQAGPDFAACADAALSLFGTAALPRVGPAALAGNLIRYGLPLLLSAIGRSFFLEDQDAQFAAYGRYDGLGPA